MENNSENSNQNRKKGNLNATLLFGICNTGLAFLALPIWAQSFTWAWWIWLVLGGVVLWVGVRFIFAKKEWQVRERSLLRAQPIVMLLLFLPVSLLFLWLGTKTGDQFDVFSAYYMAGYWVVLLGWVWLLRGLNKRLK